MKNFLSVIRNHDTLTNTAKDALSVFEIFTSKCVKGLHTKKTLLVDEKGFLACPTESNELRAPKGFVPQSSLLMGLLLFKEN